jgi:uncharacterized protein YehS (DUF1456 family)
MINNDVLRSIRYMLDLSEPKVVEIALLADSTFVARVIKGVRFIYSRPAK